MDRSAPFGFNEEIQGERFTKRRRRFAQQDRKLKKQPRIRDENILTSHQHLEITSEWRPNGASLYSNLQDSDEIRLLYLQPGLCGEMIKCIMKHAKFSKETAYEALSYVWGTEDAIHPIVINERNVYVRQNLLLAMQHLRSDTGVRVLWIDATCIDQQNIHERNHQVTQMGMIYQQATRVIIWLGSSDAESKLAFEILSSPAEWTELNKALNAQDLVKRPGQDSKLKAMSSFLGRDYWTRLWIIQEFVIARDFMLICGNDNCSGFRFSWFMELLGELNIIQHIPTKIYKNMPNAINLSVAARLCQLRKTLRHGTFLMRKRNFNDNGSGLSSRALFGMFSEFNTSKCIDQRDRIFGLHSLAHACCKKSVPIDYSLTWDVIFRKLIYHQITSHDSLPRSSKSDSGTTIMHLQEISLKTMSYFDKSQYNNSSLSLNEIESLYRTFKDWEPILSDDVELKTYARGRICYTSPPLTHLDPSKDSLVLPELTPMVELQMNYISSLNRNRKSFHPYATTETDLVTQAGFINLKGLPSALDTIKYLTQNPIHYRGCNLHKYNKDGDDKPDLGENFRQLLCNARDSFFGSNLILAFEENGLIFLASNETKIGDLLCQFTGSDIFSCYSCSCN